jgi:hypothetical protein
MGLFIYISVNSWTIILYFSLEFNTVFFFLKLFQLWLVGSCHFGFCLVWFYVFGTSLLFVTARYLRLIFYISCYSPRIIHFTKNSDSLMENGIRNQDWSVRCVCCHQGTIASRSFLLIGQGKIFIYINSHVYTYP